MTGFSVGKRKTKTISARVYNKIIEMPESGSYYWPEIWGPTYDRESPVWRVEFEIGRQALKEFGLDSPSEVLDAVGALWVSCTTSWLRYCSPTADQTRSRWPVAPEWQSVQRASLVDGAIGLERITAGKTSGDLQARMPGLVGYLSSFGALVGADGLAAVIVNLPSEIHAYCDETGKSFRDRIEDKRREIGLPT